MIDHLDSESHSQIGTASIVLRMADGPQDELVAPAAAFGHAAGRFAHGQ